MELLQSVQKHYNKFAMEKKEEQRSNIRKRNILVLIMKYLQDHKFETTAKSLCEETTIKLDQFSVCDNISLDVILQEYETFQYVKFRHYPLVVKKQPSTEAGMLNRRPYPKTRSLSRSSFSNSPSRDPSRPPSSKTHILPFDLLGSSQTSLKSDLSIEGVHLMRRTSRPLREQNSVSLERSLSVLSDGCKNKNNSATPMGLMPSALLQKDSNLSTLLSSFEALNPEWKPLIDIIAKDIFLGNLDVGWENIIGLDNAKKIIKESLVYPIKHSRFFSGLLTPWKGLLLFGPPGNGKTLLAKAVASECRSTFFNISSSTIVSKWRGDSEKLVRVLFEMARHFAPSTIFLDELDALMCKRDSASSSEHEASRRMKTELLVQIDGLNTSEDLVFVLAASNMPWDLDPAALRRLEKRILVTLPSWEDRKTMFIHHLDHGRGEKKGQPTIPLGEIDYEQLAQATPGYSGADIKLVCKESAMQSLRSVFSLLESGQADDATLLLAMSPLDTSSILSAIHRCKPSAKNLEHLYLNWEHNFGSN